MTKDAQRTILARRAAFVAAALAGVSGCTPPAPAPVLTIPTSAGADDDRAARDAESAAPITSSQPQPPEPAPVADRDSDGDGIPDVDDACPDVPGVANTDPSRNGCPTAIVRVCLSIAIPPRIEFDSRSASLKAALLPVLDDAASTLRANPNLSIEVEGHCDTTEPIAIAETRAQAVRAYLIKKGIDPARVTARGLGATSPVAPNTTLEGRARNRRVSFRTR